MKKRGWLIGLVLTLTLTISCDKESDRVPNKVSTFLNLTLNDQSYVFDSASYTLLGRENILSIHSSGVVDNDTVVINIRLPYPLSYEVYSSQKHMDDVSVSFQGEEVFRSQSDKSNMVITITDLNEKNCAISGDFSGALFNSENGDSIILANGKLRAQDKLFAEKIICPLTE